MHDPKQKPSVGIGGLDANKFILQCYLCFIALCWKLDQNAIFRDSGLPLNQQEEGHGCRNSG